MRAKTVDLPHDLPPEPCQNCGKMFIPFSADARGGIRGRHFCSTECLDERIRKERKGLVPKTEKIKYCRCAMCGRLFRKTVFAVKYCSEKCANEAKLESLRKAQKKYKDKKRKEATA